MSRNIICKTNFPCIWKKSWGSEELCRKLGFPGGSVVKNLPANADVCLIPGSGRFLRRRKEQPIPIFLSGKSHGYRSLVGYSPWGHKRVGHDLVTKTTTTCTCIIPSKWKSESRAVMSDSLWPHGLYSPWNSPGQNTGVGSLSLLQWIFPTQGLNPGLSHCRQIFYQLSHKKSPRILEWVVVSLLQWIFLTKGVN